MHARGPRRVFAPDMLVGEAQDLFSERMERWRSLFRKVYIFQVRNDDGRAHFCGISRDFGSLCFVLVYFGEVDDVGSYLIRGGRSRRYSIPGALSEKVLAKHGVGEDGADDPSYWEASWELMDLAQAHWERTAVREFARD